MPTQVHPRVSLPLPTALRARVRCGGCALPVPPVSGTCAGGRRPVGSGTGAHLLLELDTDGVGLLEEDGVAPQEVP